MVRGIIFVIIVALVAVGVLAFNSTFLINFAPISSANVCRDSDGGINLILVGTTCDSNGCVQDYCAGDLNLAEYSCSGKQKILSRHSCEFGCLNGKCGVEGAKYNLYTASTKLYLNDSINKVRQTLTETNIPSLLADGLFNWSIATIYSTYFAVGSSKIIFAKQPTNNSDPKIGISLDTSGNYLYNVTITFSTYIDFTNANSTGKNITLLKRDFVVDNETNATRLVLKADKKYILENNMPVKFKSVVNLSNGTNYAIETPIRGTLVKWLGGVQNMVKLTIQVYAPSISEDAILEGSYMIDPFLRTFKIDFNQTSVPESSWQRENFSANPSSIDGITFNMKDYRNLEQTFNWLHSDGFGNSILADSNGNKINIAEMATINTSHYGIIGNGVNGYIIKVLNITNMPNGYTNDSVLFQDLFSGQTYSLNISSEGSGQLFIENSTYTIYYTNSDIKIKYSSSSQGDITIYPHIKTYMGANVIFYEPLTISLNNYSINSSIYSFKIFNGNTYSSIPVVLSATGFNIGGQVVSASSSAIINSGKVSYEFTYVSPFTTKIFLRDVSGNQVSRPAIIVFEKAGYNSNYEALIIKTEGMGNSTDGVGVSDVEMTWGNNAVFKNLQLSSNQSIYKSIDIWGTITSLNKSNSDQYSANIKHNYQQLSNSVYITEIV
ncbi:hypothetical protein J4423_03440 [Candidatus Pacearchaeota archaeon]|nr:hypothetical protein [Candidatus Pacearchaeota archaeon]